MQHSRVKTYENNLLDVFIMLLFSETSIFVNSKWMVIKNTATITAYHHSFDLCQDTTALALSVKMLNTNVQVILLLL